jgi:hypothetical protein
MVTSLPPQPPRAPSAHPRALRGPACAALAVLVPLVALSSASSAQPRGHFPAASASAPSSAAPAASAPAGTPGAASAAASAPVLLAGDPFAPAPGAASGAPAASSAAPAAQAPWAIGPGLHHAPLSTAAASEPLSVEARITHPELVKRAVLIYRTADGPEHEVVFKRAASGPYVAVIPAADIRPPTVSYAIEIETIDGQQQAVFASRGDMFVIEVAGDLMEARERATLARLGGRRSVVTASGDYVQFGSTPADICRGTITAGKCSTALERTSISDRYWRVEAGYTYRMLGHVAEFGVRGGVVRGQSVVGDEVDRDKFAVGLNYGASTIRLRAMDWLHLEGEFLTSVTEVGFAVGGGGAVLLGDPYGSKLSLGIESVKDFGTRGYSRIDLVASSRLIISPIVEVTDMPHSAKTGVRLLTEVRFDLLDGIFVALRGGYQARDSASGGPSGGATVAYSF